MKELDACKVLEGEFDDISQVREAVVATRHDLSVSHKNGEKWTARTPNGDRTGSQLDATFQANARRLFINLLDRQESELKNAEDAVTAANKGVDDLAKQLDDKTKELEALKLDNETFKETITDRNAIIAELTAKVAMREAELDRLGEQYAGVEKEMVRLMVLTKNELKDLNDLQEAEIAADPTREVEKSSDVDISVDIALQP